MNKPNFPERKFDVFGDHVLSAEPAANIPSLGAEFFMRELTGPTTVAWNVTQACNLKCLHCFNNSGKRLTTEMSHDDAMRVVEQVIDMKVFNVCVCGGEPLLRNDLFEILKKLKSSNILISMVSNGLLIDQATANKLATAGVRFLQISIDGRTAEAHEKLRGRKGAFSKAINAARYVIGAGIDLAVAFCPNKFNIHEFSDYVDMVYNLGARSIRMMPLLRLGRTISNKEQLIPSAEQLIFFQWMVRKKTYEYVDRGLNIEWGDPLEHLYLFPRNEAKLFILELHSNGDVGISAYLPLVFGNVLDKQLRELWEEGLKDAWRHPLVKKYAAHLVDLEDLQLQKPLPWKEENLYVDLSKA